MANQTVCDAPDCPEVLRWSSPDGDANYPWFVATLSVGGPAGPCYDCGDHPAWSHNSVRVDACTREHLRMALAQKIAELTDEPATS